MIDFLIFVLVLASLVVGVVGLCRMEFGDSEIYCWTVSAEALMEAEFDEAELVFRIPAMTPELPTQERQKC